MGHKGQKGMIIKTGFMPTAAKGDKGEIGARGKLGISGGVGLPGANGQKGLMGERGYIIKLVF